SRSTSVVSPTSASGAVPPPARSSSATGSAYGSPLSRSPRDMEEPMSTDRISYHVCPLCEATCGLEITTRGREIVGIRGDEADVFSQGFICPKGYAVKALDADPDRIRTPLLRRNGVLEPVGWDDAFAEIDRRLSPILRERGRDAVAVYVGNPTAHNMALLIYGQVLARALGSRNFFSATTVDQ